MTRPLRIQYPGAVYHVTSRGNRRGAIFNDEDDRKVFFAVLCETLERFHVLCHGYCLMGNHYHLLLETIEGNLCGAMRQLNGVYTQIYNRKHHKCGHVFQGRYKAILIEKSAHLLEACRYIVLNPVRAGLTDTPEDWPWSSYQGTAGLEPEPSFLRTTWILSQFGEESLKARERYIEFVNDSCTKRIWEDVVNGTVLGSREFAGQCRTLSHGDANLSEVPRAQRYFDRPPLAELLAGPGSKGQKWLSAVYEYGYTQKEVAEHSGVHCSYVSKTIKRERSQVKT